MNKLVKVWKVNDRERSKKSKESSSRPKKTSISICGGRGQCKPAAWDLFFVVLRFQLGLRLRACSSLSSCNCIRANVDSGFSAATVKRSAHGEQTPPSGTADEGPSERQECVYVCCCGWVIASGTSVDRKHCNKPGNIPGSQGVGMVTLPRCEAEGSWRRSRTEFCVSELFQRLQAKNVQCLTTAAGWGRSPKRVEPLL